MNPLLPLKSDSALRIECLSVALCTQHAVRVRHTVICVLSSSTMLHYLTNGFRKEVIEHKMCVLIFSKTFVSNISHCKKNWARNDKKCILVFI